MSSIQLSSKASKRPQPAQGLQQLQEAWACPICLEDLGCYREEVGALTWEGRRLEAALYHLGCVSMMLLTAHKKRQAGLRANSGELKAKGQQFVLSPLTRQPVDGFLPMPSPSDREKWLRFFDWKRTGMFDAVEVCYVVTNLFPAGSGVASRLLNNCLTAPPPVEADVAEDELTISEEVLQVELLPVLIAHYGDENLAGSDANAPDASAKASRKPKAVRKPFGAIATSLYDMLCCESQGLSDPRPLSAVSSCGREVARVLLVQEMCSILDASAFPRVDCDVVKALKLLADIARPTDWCAVAMASGHFRSDVAAVREAALIVVAQSAAATQGLPFNKAAWAAISERCLLTDEDKAVRCAAITSCAWITGFAAEKPRKALRTIVPLLTSDRDWQPRLAADAAIRHIAGKHRLDSDAATHKASFRDDGDSDDGLVYQTQEGAKVKIVDAVFAVLDGFMKEDSPFLRRAGINAYVILWEPWTTRSLDAVLTLRKDKNSDVRTAVIRAIERMARPGQHQDKALRALVTFCSDPSYLLQIAAAKAMARRAPRGHKPCVDAVVELSKEMSSRIRPNVAARGDALTEVCVCSDMLTTLGQLAAPGHAPTIHLCQTLLHSTPAHHSSITGAAQSTLGQVLPTTSAAGTPLRPMSSGFFNCLPCRRKVRREASQARRPASCDVASSEGS
eukprot:TRINITY_DN91607_c0_g1_i1.p1 TRINITY_DN91607_c0_g1~~TRINITY_DN91607_c0_g1_i1.p1  ORF type:complete len:679 (-),score=66.47 TRINITY_DN91607_c0_g1_i1:52-2088(-)